MQQPCTEPSLSQNRKVPEQGQGTALGLGVPPETVLVLQKSLTSVNSPRPHVR